MNRDLLKKELLRDEGLRLKIYVDSEGVPTVGVGHNLSDMEITEPEALAYLEADIDRTVKDLDRELPWWRELDQVRQHVLLNMAFNMGVKERRKDGTIRGLVTFTTTLAFVKHGMYGEAAISMLQSLWAKQVGVRAKRLSQQMQDGPPKEV